MTDADVFATLDLIRKNQGQLISVTPVRETLEDYFFERLNAQDVQEVKR